MSVFPLYDTIIVQLAETESVSEGGIHIPDSTLKRDQKVVIIVAVGEGKLLSTGEVVPLKVHPGDEVVLEQFSGTEFAHDGENYIAVCVDDILAVLR